jgi:hypothetical protein
MVKEVKNMVSIFKKKEVEEDSSNGKDPLSVLRELEKEEVSLMEEKGQLLALKEKLQLKAEEKIEIMKLRIQTLRNEISELKSQCEELENSVSLS